MAFVIADRVKETTTTAGTGTVTLAGASLGYQSFAVIGNSNTTYYCISGQTNSEWEVGIGTYTSSGTTLSRDTVLSSSNSGNLVNFSAGTKDVFVTYPASKAIYNSGPLGTPSSGTVTNLTGTASININGTVGATTPTTGAFTTLSATGVATFSAGTAAAPAITTSGDTNNGIYFPAADNVAITTGGTQRVLVDSSGNVGIGTSSPGNAKLNVQGFASYRGDAYTIASFCANSTLAPLNITQLSDGTIPSISAGQNSTGTWAAGLGFMTSGVERMRIDSSGNVGIGLTPSYKLDVLGSVRAIPAATQDAVIVAGRAGGTGSYAVTLTPTTLSASRTLTLPDNSGTVLTTGATVAVSNGGTGQTTYTDGQLLIGNTTGNTLTKATLTGTANQITVTNGNGSITLSAPQSINTTASVQFGSFGVGTAASGTTGEIRATNNVTAYYSDDRLKTRLGKIENALDKVGKLNGFYYEANETAQALGYKAKREVGVSAQEVQAVLPEIVAPAPIDEKYMTIYYERLVPLLVEAIKELTARVEMLEAK